MSEAKMGVAVFGLGRAGLYHLPNLAAHPDVCVRWLVDVAGAGDRAVQLCERYGLQHAQFVDTENCHKVFDDPGTKAVVVAAPTVFHAEIIKTAVAAGKHVLCEKPISLTADTVRVCYDAARARGCVLFCAFNRRFDSHHVELRERLRSGELGSPRVIHYNARDPKTSRGFVHTYIKPSGGIFCDSAIHQLDYVVWLLGETPCSVLAVGGQTSEEAEAFRACDDVDTTLITLQFPSGVRAHIEVLRETQRDFAYFRMEVVGTRGSYFSHKVTNTTLATVSMDGSGEETTCPMDFSDSFKRELDCFFRVLQGREECPVSAEEVILASELADACKASLKEGRVIQFRS